MSSNISTEGEEEIGTEVEAEDDDKTPVLSRENSDVQNKSIAPIWKWEKDEEKRKTSFSRGPSICSNSSRRTMIINDENGEKRYAEARFRRDFGTSSPCRRKIEESPGSLRRSNTLDTSPSSSRKSVTFDPESPVLARKSSTISTASLHSDSTLQTLVSTDLPESPTLPRRGSSKRAERSPIVQKKTISSMIDSGIHFASPLPPRRRETDSPLTRRKDLESNSHSPVIRRKESLLAYTRRESFRRQSENSNREPGPSSIRDSVTRKYSFPEGKIWYVDDASNYHHHGAESTLLETKSLQMPVIASPVLRTSNNHNKLLVRRASERIGSSETTASKLLSRQSPPSLRKSDLKQNNASTKDLNLISSKSDANNSKDITVRSNSENRSRNNKMEAEQYYSTTNEIRKVEATNTNRPSPKLLKQSLIKNEVKKCSDTEVAATHVKNDVRPHVSLQQRESTISNSVRIRKKTRSILMEPLEVNWSVDEIRSKFQKASEPPPFLDTIYSSYSLK